MISGGQYVMTAGTVLMPLWSVSSWDMHTLEVSASVRNVTVLMQAVSIYLLFVDGIGYSNAFFGAGTGPIFLDNVFCTSSASQLLECSSSPILTHNCQHSEDAGVGCEGMLLQQC